MYGQRLGNSGLLWPSWVNEANPVAEEEARGRSGGGGMAGIQLAKITYHNRVRLGMGVLKCEFAMMTTGICPKGEDGNPRELISMAGRIQKSRTYHIKKG